MLNSSPYEVSRVFSLHVLVFLAVHPVVLNGQNLVPNHSFEEYEWRDGDKVIVDWSGCLKNDSPDFFLASSSEASEFEQTKLIPPFQGKSYAGIFCYRNDPVAKYQDVREFLQVRLTEPLIRDSIYDLSLSIALDPESNLALKQLHIVFSEKRIRLKREKNAFELTPSLVIRDDSLDSREWKTYHLNYKAEGDELYMLIGNFVNDARSRKKYIRSELKQEFSKWKMNEGERVAYYYFDEIKVALPVYETKDQPAPAPEIKDQPKEELEIDIEKVRPDSLILLKNVYFETDKYEILDESYPELNILLKFMKEYPAVEIFIEGHTDNTGTDQYNQELSEQRARSVAEFLFSHGISEERISMAGYGDKRPVGDNNTIEGREMNRRVGFRITAK